MANTLANKKIVIAGGTSGIGLALVQLLSSENAHITVLGRDPQKISNLKKSLPEVDVVALDASDRSALDNFFAQQKEVDHLVLAVSGANGGGMFSTLDLQDLRKGFENKFWPQLNAIQAALPFIRPGGSITLITAASSMWNLPGTSGLAALNGGLEIMVPILSKELKPLRINAVSPGIIDTPWWDFLNEDAKKQVFSDFSNQVNVGRVGHPEEIAETVRFIMTTEYINGITIGCHGGMN